VELFKVIKEWPTERWPKGVLSLQSIVKIRKVEPREIFRTHHRDRIVNANSRQDGRRRRCPTQAAPHPQRGRVPASEIAPDPSITWLVGREGGFAEEARAERAGYRALRARPAGPCAPRPRRSRPGAPAGAVERSRLGASRTAGASIACSEGHRPHRPHSSQIMAKAVSCSGRRLGASGRVPPPRWGKCTSKRPPGPGRATATSPLKTRTV